MDTFQIDKGESVYTSDGDKFGSVVEVKSNLVVVRRGFFPTDYYIPFSAFSGADEQGANLKLGKDAALEQGWDNAPKEVGTRAESPPTGADSTFWPDAADTEATGVAVVDQVGTQSFVRDSLPDGGSHRQMDDSIVVPIREEELSATTTAREAGNVEITTDVISEERTLEVPVTDERVRVQRRVFEQPVDAEIGADAFQRKVIEVPLRTEEVQLQTQARVIGEVAVKKEQFQRTEAVTGTVRREEVTVDEHAADLAVASEPVEVAAPSASARRGGERANRSAKQKRRH